jgi:NDP-sugar pyrophosphorylase family protein
MGSSTFEAGSSRSRRSPSRHFVNAEVLSPSIVARIEPGRRADMTGSPRRRLDRRAVAAFPILKYWIDIGQPADFERASADYDRIFR